MIAISLSLAPARLSRSISRTTYCASSRSSNASNRVTALPLGFSVQSFFSFRS